MRRGVEWHVLTLVTLALVAFGIVMVYSATSASAAVGGGDPMQYLARQATFAVIGIAGMLAATRFSYRRLRVAAPAALVAGSCFLAVHVRVRAPRARAARAAAAAETA